MALYTIDELHLIIEEAEEYLKEHPLDPKYEEDQELYDDRCVLEFGNRNLIPNEQKKAYWCKDMIEMCNEELKKISNFIPPPQPNGK